MSTYAEQRAKALQLLTRETLRDLPEVCTDFMRSIDSTTQPLTRYAYATDLQLFFNYLTSEVSKFGHLKPCEIQPEHLGDVSPGDIYMYLEYLSYYIKDDAEHSNQDMGKLRKLSSLRSFYKFLFKNGFIDADITALVDMPKRHEKPIIRLEIDEVARMLDIVETGDHLSDQQRKYNDNTRLRDLAILSLFLGTGIRVSELVGINIDDLDFTLNGFLVTRKGGNQAILYFPDEVASVLQDYLKVRRNIEALEGHEDALFLSLQRKRISVRAIQVMVKKYATLAAPLKKHLSPHKLRSTFGTNLYHETGDIYLVADVLGHSDVNTTRRHYAAMSDERRRMAARSVKLRDDSKSDDSVPVQPGDRSPDED